MPRLPAPTDLSGTAELAAIDNAIGVFKKQIQTLRPEQQNALTGLVDQLALVREKFAVEAPKANLRLQRLVAANKKKHEMIMAGFKAKKEMLEKRRAELAELQKKKNEEMAKKPKSTAPIARPRKKNIQQTKPLPFLPGKALRDWLVPAEAPKTPSTPKIHGNIWDDWKAVPPPISKEDINPLHDDLDPVN